MGNIARPPCDEGAILAGPCETPATTDGPWILVAAILGSSMAFIDGTVVNVALPALQSALSATLASLPLFLAGVALAASYIPARRAAAVDPMTALKYE